MKTVILKPKIFMKKLFLFFLTLLSFANVQGQTFFSDNASRGDSALNTGSSGDIYVFNMLRAAVGTVNIRWQVLDHSPNLLQANSWSLGGICDNITCRDSNDVLTGRRYFASYTTTREDFHVIFHANNAPVNSSAWVRFSATDTAAGGTSRTLTFMATKTPLGITTTVRTEDNIKVYPNPARESVNVTFDGNDNVKTVGVYNLLGQPISVYHVVGSSANIPLNEVPSGVYFLRMYDGQGKIVATRRFTRQ